MNENTIVHETSEPAKAEREVINQLLIDKFGIDTVTGLPMWRLSWSDSQYNKERGTFEDYTESGIYLRTVTEVREVPKYPYLKGLYLLENLQGVPPQNADDLPSAKLTYECIHPLMHKIHQTYLPPYWPFVEFVIDCFYAGLGRKSLRKYVSADEGVDQLELKRKRVDDISRYLYGDETPVTDAFAYGTGVVVPRKQFGDAEHNFKDN